MRAAAAAAALGALGAAACGGQVGTIELELTTAPGSTVLDEVQRLRVTLTEPRTVVEATRGADGFDLVLDVDATGLGGSLIVEGFDATDAAIAVGQSPPFPVAAINAKVVVYVAAPLSIAASPARLPAARTGVASAPLTYGVAIAGGRDDDGTVADGVFIYSAFDHALTEGLALPAPRDQPVLAVGSNNAVYVFGGLGPDDAPAGTLWRFDTNVAPSGAYREISNDPELARAGEHAVSLEAERIVITGAPALDLDFSALAPRDDAPMLAPSGAATPIGGAPVAVFAGDPAVRLAGDGFEPLAATIAPTATAVALPTGAIAFAGADATRDLVVVDAATGAVSRVTDALSVPRARPAVAATARYLVVAGGADADGAPIASADVLDATTLELVTTLPCLARAGATAHALPDDQIVIVGGAPANDTLELFTPPAPAP